MRREWTSKQLELDAEMMKLLDDNWLRPMPRSSVFAVVHGARTVRLNGNPVGVGTSPRKSCSSRSDPTGCRIVADSLSVDGSP